MKAEDIYIIAKEWLKKSDEYSALDWVKLMADDLQKRFNYELEKSKWIYTKDQLPMCFETGNWDGKKSEIVIAETIKGEKFLAECYEGQMDGSYFFDWYFVDTISKNDWPVNDPVVRWQKIEY